MSAWIVSKKHIDAMVTFALDAGPGRSKLRWRMDETDPELTHAKGSAWGPGCHMEFKRAWCELTPESAGRVGAMLWAENYRSVNHRYNEDETEDPYQFERYNGPVKLTPRAMVKLLDCYEYQSCEHPEWEDSEAHRFCLALRRRILSQIVERHAEYESAPWGID